MPAACHGVVPIHRDEDGLEPLPVSPEFPMTICSTVLDSEKIMPFPLFAEIGDGQVCLSRLRCMTLDTQDHVLQPQDVAEHLVKVLVIQ